MVSKIILISVFVLLLPTSCRSYEKTQEQRNKVAQGVSTRNLSIYDTAGPFDAGVLMEKATLVSEKRKEFLWEHWRQQRLGYIVTVTYTKEGDKVTLHEYIEPDDKGRWHILVSVNKLLVDREYWAKTKITRTIPAEESYKVYFLERLSPGKTKTTTQKKIPLNQPLPPESFVLRFKDEKGKLMGYL